MAAITTAAMAAAGVGLEVANAVKQNKLQKDAQAAAKQAKQNIKGIREQNPFSGVQVPTMGNKLAMEQVNQQASNSLAALQGTGAEGVIAGTSGLNQSVRNAELDIAARQDDQKFQRDSMEADAQGGINQRQAQRDYYTEMSGLEGSQQAASDAQFNRNQSIQRAMSGLSAGVGSLAGTDKFDYMTPGSTRRLGRKTKFKARSNEDLQNEQIEPPQPQ